MACNYSKALKEIALFNAILKSISFSFYTFAFIDIYVYIRLSVSTFTHTYMILIGIFAAYCAMYVMIAFTKKKVYYCGGIAIKE